MTTLTMKDEKRVEIIRSRNLTLIKKP